MKKIKELHRAIRRILGIISLIIIYLVCLPYIGILIILGIVFFIIKGDFVTESRLDNFTNWFNNIGHLLIEFDKV